MNVTKKEARPRCHESRAGTANTSEPSMTEADDKAGFGCCAGCGRRVRGRTFGGIQSSRAGTLVWCRACAESQRQPSLQIAEVWP